MIRHFQIIHIIIQRKIESSGFKESLNNLHLLKINWFFKNFHHLQNWMHKKRGNDKYFLSREVTPMQVKDKTLNNNVEDLTTAVNQMNGNLILMIKDRLDCIPGNLLSSCPASSAGTSPIHAIRVRNNKLWSQDIFTWVLTFWG